MGVLLTGKEQCSLFWYIHYAFKACLPKSWYIWMFSYYSLAHDNAYVNVRLLTEVRCNILYCWLLCCLNCVSCSPLCFRCVTYVCIWYPRRLNKLTLQRGTCAIVFVNQYISTHDQVRKETIDCFIITFSFFFKSKYTYGEKSQSNTNINI